MVYTLWQENDLVKYLNILSKLKEVAVIISVKDILGTHLNDDVLQELRNLGCEKLRIFSEGDRWRPYVAVVKNNVIIQEKIGDLNDSVRIKCELDGKSIDVLSAPFYSGNIASILIDKKEYSVNSRGFNIVVISSNGDVVDSVCFDTHVRNFKCTRKFDRMLIRVDGSEADGLTNRDCGNVRKRLLLENLIGEKKFCEISKYSPKIKIRFFICGRLAQCASVTSVIQAFINDDNYDVLLVFQWKGKEFVQWAGRLTSGRLVKVIHDSEYKIENDKPDIAFFNKAGEYYKDYESIALKIGLRLELINGVIRDYSLSGLADNLFKHKVDAILVEKYFYKCLEDVGLVEKYPLYCFGNPKFDVIYKARMGENCLRDEWIKTKGKKTIVWSFDHNWKLNDCTFDLYFESFLDYMSNDEELCLVIRPHYTAVIEMLQNRIWTEEDIQRLRTYARSTPNIIWDEEPDYGMAFSVADAVITDLNCGISLSATVLNVPIGITHRYDGEDCEPQYPEINECHYQIRNIDDAISFFEMIKRGEDPLEVRRNLIRDSYILHFDGQNGKRIHDFIDEKYREKAIHMDEEKP